MRKPMMIAGTCAALLAPALAQRPTADPDPAWRTAKPEGEPRRCIVSTAIRFPRIHDDRTIDFHMETGEIYRNTLPRACNSLFQRDNFIQRTNSAGQLCSTDFIAPTLPGGGISAGAPCRLGVFQRIGNYGVLPSGARTGKDKQD